MNGVDRLDKLLSELLSCNRIPDCSIRVCINRDGRAQKILGAKV